MYIYVCIYIYIYIYICIYISERRVLSLSIFLSLPLSISPSLSFSLFLSVSLFLCLSSATLNGPLLTPGSLRALLSECFYRLNLKFLGKKSVFSENPYFSWTRVALGGSRAQAEAPPLATRPTVHVSRFVGKFWHHQCTESATSKYLPTSQCLSALLGSARESEVYPGRSHTGKRHVLRSFFLPCSTFFLAEKQSSLTNLARTLFFLFEEPVSDLRTRQQMDSFLLG